MGIEFAIPATIYEHEPRNPIAISSINRPEDCELFESLIAAIAEGDELLLRRNTLTVMRGRRRIRKFERPGRLLWRVLNFS